MEDTDIDKELEKAKNDLFQLETEMKSETELEKIKEKIRVLKFRKKHPKLIGVTGRLEQGTKRFFKSLGSGLSKAGKALEKSDAYIAKEQAKERTNKPKKKSKDSLDDALNLLD